MAQRPAKPRREETEHLWFEYDAYAKLENAVTFLITDLTVFQDYLKVNPPPLPSNLIQQFAKDLKAFKEEADILSSDYRFTRAAEVAALLWNKLDPHSHHTLGEMASASHLKRMEKALESWTLAKDPALIEWKPALSALAEAVLQKMSSLLLQIEKS